MTAVQGEGFAKQRLSRVKVPVLGRDTPQMIISAGQARITPQRVQQRLSAVLSTALLEQDEAQLHIGWPEIRAERQGLAEVLLGLGQLIDLDRQQGRPIVGLKMARRELSGPVIQLSRRRQLPIAPGAFR